MIRWAVPIGSVLLGAAILFGLSGASMELGAGQGLGMIALIGASMAMILLRVRPATTAVAARPLADVRVEGEPWQHLHDELRRSRRHGHPFVLARIKMGAGLSAMGGGPAGASRRAEMILDAVEAVLRTTDGCWLHDGNVYALLPETDRSMADNFVQRARQMYPGVLSSADVALVGFPEDGITSGSLLAAFTDGSPKGQTDPVGSRSRPASITSRDPLLSPSMMTVASGVSPRSAERQPRTGSPDVELVTTDSRR